MIKYIKDSIRELKHVVWPTREETTNYFVIVVVVLFLFGLYLFIASTLFTKGLFALKDIFGNTKVTNEITLPENASKNLDLNIISDEVKPTIKINNDSTKTIEITRTGSKIK